MGVQAKRKKKGFFRKILFSVRALKRRVKESCLTNKRALPEMTAAKEEESLDIVSGLEWDIDELDMDALDKEMENAWHNALEELKMLGAFDEDTPDVKPADEPTKPAPVNGLPIVLVEKKEHMSLMERREFERKCETEDVYELVNLPLETDAFSAPCRIPFEHKGTACELIVNTNSVIRSDGKLANNIIFVRPDTYYRSNTDPERFPCECLCAVDDKTFALFDGVETLQDKVHQIGIYSRLSKAQREHICAMASRPVQTDDDSIVDECGFTPIRDEKALIMMYTVCRNTYSSSVRARADALIAQMRHAHGSDRQDLINQLAFTVGIDTAVQTHPMRTYDEYMAILDKHIFGLRELKESMVEFLIAMQVSGAAYFVLLLVGPPGVGKTSICDGLAECMDVPVVHIDCSGVDTVTMSGLIKSYSGAKAGKFMDGLFEKGRTDLLVRLDELDKMERGKDGDPYGSLIKPLGPQRKYFDEYVADDTDVSATKFIATANDINKIPGYIRSRFENCIFYIDPYTEDEKVSIAANHIIPKKLEEFHLSGADCTFDEQALRLIIRNYCSDEGVRELSGNITMLLRKALTEWKRNIIQLPLTIDCDYVTSHLRRKARTDQKRAIGF